MANVPHDPDYPGTGLRLWLRRLSASQRAAAEIALEREPALRRELAAFLAEAIDFDRWLAGLTPDERAPVDLALVGDPDLREEVGVVISAMERSHREAFLRRFRYAIVNDSRISPVLEGLHGVAREIRRDRRSTEGEAA